MLTLTESHIETKGPYYYRVRGLTPTLIGERRPPAGSSLPSSTLRGWRRRGTTRAGPPKSCGQGEGQHPHRETQPGRRSPRATSAKRRARPGRLLSASGRSAAAPCGLLLIGCTLNFGISIKPHFRNTLIAVRGRDTRGRDTVRPSLDLSPPWTVGRCRPLLPSAEQSFTSDNEY